MIGIAEGFRIISIIIGLLIGYFTYMIHRFTEGGSKGWEYFAIGGLSLTLWSTLQVVFSLIINSPVPRIILGTVTLPLIAIFSSIGPVKLLEDMNIKKPKWLTIRNVLYYFILVIIALSLYNFLTPFNYPSNEILSIAHDTIPFCFIIGVFGNYLLWKGIKSKVWFLIMISAISIIIGTGLISYSGNCCGPGEVLAGQEICAKYPYDYVASTPLSCVEFLIPISLFGSLFLIIGVLLYAIAFGILWNRMR